MESNSFKIASVDWDKFDWENTEESRGKLRMRKVLEHIPSNGLHLDVGTGRGDGTYLVSQKKKTVGIDFGLKSLKIAAKKNHNLIQADACNLPFKSDIFESVTCLDVLEHIPGAEKAIGEIYRVLKPDGCLILQTPSVEITYIKRIGIILDLPFRMIKRILGRYHEDRRYPQPYDKEIPIKKIRDILLSSGFTIKKEKIVNYWHPSLIIRVFSFSNVFICTKGVEKYAKK